MNNKMAPLMLALVLLITPAVMADFDETNAAMTPDRHNIEFDDNATLSAVSYRNFSVDAEANAYTNLVAALPENFTVDMDITVDEGTTYTPLATGRANTTESVNQTVADNATLRYTFHFPADRDVQTLTVDFIIALDEGTSEGGSGGVQDPSISHKVILYFYDAESDSDSDGMADAWEIEHFGDLDSLPGNDADGDGYTNLEEFNAGTDPNNAASIPRESVTAGGRVDDREIGAFVTGLLVFTLVGAIALLFLPTSKEAGAAWIVLSVGVATLAAFAVVATFDYFVLDHPGFAWWSYVGVSWQEWVVLGLALVAVLGTSAGLFLKLNETEERNALIPVGIGIGVVLILGYVFFGLLDIALPF